MTFDPRAFRGKKACVIGVGRSGAACARLLLRRGFKVLASDARPRAEVRRSLGRAASAVSIEAGGHGERGLSCAFAVKSPGLPPALPLLRQLRDKGIPVFSELEVALAFSRCREMVAVTGTNGKTTTTALVGAMLGRRAKICGNIGRPASDVAPTAGPKDVLVVEASSYQLADSTRFHPQAAALLNVTADHLDHHGGMAEYIEAKARVFREQGPEDSAVFNADDPLVMKLSRRCAARRLYFGQAGPVNAWVEKGRLVADLPGGRPLKFLPPALPGRHNLDNAMAAVLLALSRRVKPAAIQKALRSFRGVEHRLEDVGVIRGLKCVNDSKATNVDSTLVALKALAPASASAERRILLILGGLHKGSPYSPLQPWVSTGVKGILTIGSAARKIEEDLSGTVPIFPCGDLGTAVETAFKIGSRGDTLLLSPACASFDQFQDYEDRGRRFKALVEDHR